MSDFSINNSVLVNVDTTIWTGWAKLDAADTPTAANGLPPKDLYNGGSIKIFDTALLLKFRNFKTRAATVCSAVGCRLLGGWLIGEDYLDQLEENLAAVYTDWRAAVDAFVLDYPMKSAAWAKANPEWETVIRRKQPSCQDIGTRFHFAWQTFRLSPETTSARSLGNETDSLAQSIPDKALQSVIDSLNTLYNDSFNKPGDPSPKAYAALCKIADRAEALGFANPQAARLAPVLQDLAAKKNHVLTRLVLSRMGDATGVANILLTNDNGGVESLLIQPGRDEFLGAIASADWQSSDALLSEANALLKPAPAAPLNSLDVLDNLGLF